MCDHNYVERLLQDTNVQYMSSPGVRARPTVFLISKINDYFDYTILIEGKTAMLLWQRFQYDVFTEQISRTI